MFFFLKKPYFRRGEGLSQYTFNPVDNSQTVNHEHVDIRTSSSLGHSNNA